MKKFTIAALFVALVSILSSCTEENVTPAGGATKTETNENRWD